MTPRRKPLPFPEFVALLALLMATVAYSVDAMLPLLRPIGEDLAPHAPEQAQLVITVFMVGLGLGTFTMGPISDAFGRKPVMLAGIVLYMVAAVVAALSQNLAVLLAARFVQGLGTSAPRTVSQAMVRDLYAGRQMARVVSFGMTVFTLFPAVAPFVGSLVGAAFGWRAIFVSFLVFGAVTLLWLGLRQPETLATENRRPLAIGPLWSALKTVLGHAQVRLYLAAMTFTFTTMLLWLSTVAQLFDTAFDRADEFPSWFAMVALLSAPASLLNARLVMRFGMQRMVTVALGMQLAMVSLCLLGFGLHLPFAGFALFVAMMLIQFFTIGFLVGNLNALTLEPMGHVAGMAASVAGGVSTMCAAFLAALLAHFVAGDPAVLAAGVLLALLGSAACMALARRVG